MEGLFDGINWVAKEQLVFQRMSLRGVAERGFCRPPWRVGGEHPPLISYAYDFIKLKLDLAVMLLIVTVVVLQSWEEFVGPSYL